MTHTKTSRLPEIGKTVIYQMIPRLFANTCKDCVPDGDITRNGCGKLNDITSNVLKLSLIHI